MRPVMSKIYRQDPYLGFDVNAIAPDMQGWGYEDPIFGQVIAALHPSLIIEVGTWKGMSAMRMARIAKALSITTEVVCVDTWLGSPEHVLADQESWYQSLQFKNGYPQLFYTFMANIVHSGLQDSITPFPATSENAAMMFSKWGIQADLIYIDAAHEYMPAKADFDRFWPVLSDNGLMVCDDYVDSWPSVIRAVDDFVREKGVEGSFVGRPGKATIAKRPTAALQSIRTLTFGV